MRAVPAWNKGYFFDAHYGLEEVFRKVELVVELVEQIGLIDSVEPIITNKGSYLRGILLFDEVLDVCFKKFTGYLTYRKDLCRLRC